MNHIFRPLVLGATTFLLSCSGNPEYAHLTNGFDFEIKAIATSESGSIQEFLLPPRSRVKTTLDGKYEFEFKSPEGKVIQKMSAAIPSSGDRKKDCTMFINVMGSAAIVEQEIAYGIGGGTSTYTTRGRANTTFCAQYGFETKEPPEAVSVDSGKMRAKVKWIRYDGEGDWKVSVKRLLESGDPSHKSRTLAWNIAMTAFNHDPAPNKAALMGFEGAFLSTCKVFIDLNEMKDPMEPTKLLTKSPRKECVRKTRAFFSSISKK